MIFSFIHSALDCLAGDDEAARVPNLVGRAEEQEGHVFQNKVLGRTTVCENTKRPPPRKILRILLLGGNRRKIHAGRASSRAPPRAPEPYTSHGRRRWGSRARHRREPSSSARTWQLARRQHRPPRPPGPHRLVSHTPPRPSLPHVAMRPLCGVRGPRAEISAMTC